MRLQYSLSWAWLNPFLAFAVTHWETDNGQHRPVSLSRIRFRPDSLHSRGRLSRSHADIVPEVFCFCSQLQHSAHHPTATASAKNVPGRKSI